MAMSLICCLFFFNDTATTEIYTLSLHDALPIWYPVGQPSHPQSARQARRQHQRRDLRRGALGVALVQAQEELQVLIGAADRGDRAHAPGEEEIESGRAKHGSDRSGVRDQGLG